MNNRRFILQYLPVVALLVTILSVYWRVGDCEFIGFDDDLYVSENIHVRQGLTPGSIKWAFTASHASTWQPLVWLSYMAESEIQRHEITPGLYHWTNLILHLLNVLLLLYLLCRMTGSFYPALTVAAFFGLHPVHAESVVWVAERKDVLSTFFWMLTLILYERYSVRRNPLRYTAFTVSFVMGLMAKPMLVTLPAVMLILDYWPLGRSKEGWRSLLLEKIPLLLPVAISTILTFLVQEEGGSITSLDESGIGVRLANVPVFYCQYLGKIFWPVPLAVLYLHPGPPSFVQSAGSIALLLSVTAAAWKYRAKHPFLMAGWLWFLVTLLPVIGLVRFGLHGIADRFLYIPAVGIYVAVIWGAVSNVKYRTAAAAAASAVLCACAALSFSQVGIWKSNITLFTHAIRVTEDNWAMHNCLGAALERTGEVDAARREFEAAAAVNQKRPRIFYNLGCVKQKQGDLDGAVEAYRMALDISDDYIKARYNLAAAYSALRRYNDAIAEYENVIKADPSNLMAHNNLGAAYTKQGRYDLALESYHKVLTIEPGYITARYNLGAIYFQLNRYNEAAEAFQTILTIVPEHQEAEKGLALVNSKIGVAKQQGN